MQFLSQSVMLGHDLSCVSALHIAQTHSNAQANSDRRL